MVKICSLTATAVALASVGTVMAPTATARASDDLGQTTPGLASKEELNAITLSVIDRKVSLSLAVEMHIQIELTESALDQIRDPSFRQLVENKQRLYRGLFDTLDSLVAGEASSMLVDAGELSVDDAAGVGRLPENSPDTRQTDDATYDERRAANAAVTTTKRIGLRKLLKRATDSAILSARLDIAGEYSDLLAAELETSAPEQFDRCFRPVDHVNQMQVVAMLRVFEQRASDDLARIIHRATVAAEGHLRQGQDLVDRSNGPAGEPSPSRGLAAAIE